MQALLLKDMYVLTKNLKTFIFIAIIFALAFRENAGSFLIFYAAMLPVTSMAYDEQSKWPQLALMLPYSIRDIVLSKYLLGWLLVGVVTLLSMVLIFVNIDYIFVNLIIFCAALCFMAFVLPLVFWLGTEKGRMLMIALMAGLFGVVSAIGYISIVYGMGITDDSIVVLLAAALIGVALLNALSIMLSVKLYGRRIMQS